MLAWFEIDLNVRTATDKFLLDRAGLLAAKDRDLRQAKLRPLPQAVLALVRGKQFLDALGKGDLDFILSMVREDRRDSVAYLRRFTRVAEAPVDGRGAEHRGPSDLEYGARTLSQ